jgi:hypothetical protein
MKNKYCLTIHLNEWFFFVNKKTTPLSDLSKISFLCVTLYKYK